ncbi:MAG TPA: glycosyltransferase family 39 protein [Patescibacteria group bacterium]|nr:glycosyltransferase family 39 protein [Patescibacteria group bacterium]
MKRLLICIVLAISFLIRVASVTNFPVGFNADEASFGYDAYSILHTGRDQWGNLLPIVLKSFGDYKSPVYGYLDVPFIAIFGLNVFATRFPNVLVGTLAVLFVYLLTKELFEKYKNNLGINDTFSPAIVTAFLLAVNPWAVMMSRGAFEANLITLFLPAGIYFFLKGLKHSKFFIWSAIFFGISLFTYHSAKLITPLVIIGLFVIFYKDLKRIGFRKLFLSLVIFIIFCIAIAYSFTLGGGARISERSITQGALEEGAEAKIKLIQMGKNPIVSKILHNKYQVVANRFTTNYIQYFSPRFLFTKGAAEFYYGMVANVGTIYIFEGILLFGLIPVLLNKKSRLVLLPIIVWLLIAPLPAALASGTGYSGNRAEGMLPVLQILEGFGFIGWTLFLRGKKFSVLPTLVFCIFSIYQIFIFKSDYFKPQPNNVNGQMLYGNLDMANYLHENSNGRNVILSRSLSEPQIFIAFSSKLPPSDYQKNTKNWNFDKSGLSWLDQLPSYSLANYTIRSFDWKTDVNLPNTLLVGHPDDFPKNIVAIKTFYFPDGTPSIYVVNPLNKAYAKAN